MRRLVLLLPLVLSCAPPPPTPHYAEEDRGADRDGDGIADLDDNCPEEPEDGLPPKANDGCPADDPDQDGVPRLADKCPEAKEDHLPPDPNDGCPSNDSDGDGVADAVDKCPGAREDNLPPAPNDGCPAADRDKDGVADVLDQCPTQPETYNGYLDADGCPDTLPAEQTVVLDPKGLVLDVPNMKLDFELGSSALTPKGQSTAIEIAKTIAKHPEWDRLEVEGHASSKGDDASNVTLTLERARTVGRAFAQQGIDARRIVAVGYGEYCPKVDKGDDIDDPVNRRVEVKIVRISGHWQEVPRGCWRAIGKGIDPTKVAAGLPPAPPKAYETHGGGV